MIGEQGRHTLKCVTEEEREVYSRESFKIKKTGREI